MAKPDEQYLVMAWKWPGASQKIVELSDNREDRVYFYPPSVYKEDQLHFAGHAALAKMKELAYGEVEEGRPVPGFAIVPARVLPALQRARDVRVVASMDALEKSLVKIVPTVEEEAPKPELGNLPLEKLVNPGVEEDSYDCEFCGREAHFNREGYIAHLKNYHLYGKKDAKRRAEIEKVLEGLEGGKE